MEKLNANLSADQVKQQLDENLRRAVVDNRHSFRQLVLSTYSPAGYPESRYVILRAYNGGIFTVFSDRRTQKLASIEKHAKVSLLFYHPSRKVQLRVYGNAIIEPQTDKYWAKVARKQDYNTVQAPGTPIDQPSYEMKEPEDGSYFSVLKVHPETMDVLQLGRDQHLRLSFALKDGKWQGTWLVP